MSRSLRIFLLVSAVVVLSDSVLVLVNLLKARDVLEQTIQERGRVLRESFEIAKSTTELQLTAVASFVADVEQVRSLYADGFAAQRREGGGSGGLITEIHRAALLKVVGSRWSSLQFRFLLRQFGFYFPDGTAFLRAEAPFRHGDVSGSFLISTVNDKRRPVAGFEVDHWSTGLRAAAPVLVGGAGEGRYLGAIEVGTSFDPLLVPICPTADCGLAVLLTANLVDAMTPYARDAEFTEDKRAGGWFVEAASNPALIRQFIASEEPPRIGHTGTALVEVAGRSWYGVSHFPLYDVRGQMSPGVDPVGVVVAWQDATDLVATYHETVVINVVAALLGLLLVEAMLVVGMRVATARLRDEVAERTAEVCSLLDQVTELAQHDTLTGLPNRRCFEMRFEEEAARASRSDRSFSLVLIDLDHFKRINDSHGHGVGDAVLKRFARMVQTSLRAGDVCCRWGGEEFLVMLPETSGNQAVGMMERLRFELIRINAHDPGDGAVPFAFSGGVAEWRSGEDIDSLLRRADRAMYQAKAAGRDRILLEQAV